MTTTAGPDIIPREAASLPELRADALEAVLSDNTQRVYAAQWRLFADWCGDVGLRPLPAEPLTVAHYLAARAGDGARGQLTVRADSGAWLAVQVMAHNLARWTARIGLGPAAGDHQDPPTTLLLYRRTAHPLGAPPHFASAKALALGNPVQWRPGTIASPATPSLTAAVCR